MKKFAIAIVIATIACGLIDKAFHPEKRWIHIPRA